MDQTVYVVEWDKGTAKFPTDEEARTFQRDNNLTGSSRYGTTA